MCSTCDSFLYLSLLLAGPFAGVDFLTGSSSSRKSKLSLFISCNGFPLDFFTGASFLIFVGGVSLRRESSLTESSSSSVFSISESGFARFFEATAFALVVAFGFVAVVFGAAFFGLVF
jgi:hypothetical protein